MSNDEYTAPEDGQIPGLGISEDELLSRIAADRIVIERGLDLAETLSEKAARQEEERDAAMEAATKRGGKPKFVLTDEERAWDDHNDRALTIIAQKNKAVLRAFGLDPRRSALFPEFAEALAAACDPQNPLTYDPSDREFSLSETWGPAAVTITHCPWTGKPFPPSLADTWFDLVSEHFGTEDWSYDDARTRLPEFFTEQWWTSRGL